MPAASVPNPLGSDGGGVKAAADIRVDKIDADGFIFDLDFILCRIGRSELYGLKYFRATVLVKFNSCCHVSSRTYRQGLLHMVKFRPILYLVTPFTMAGNKPFNKQQAEPRERDPQVAGLKVPPHSIEAEQSVLGGLMLDNERWDDVAERVVADDFYTRPHRHIFY
ncbi:replicative DNA helicase [Escherichia coli]|uniref:Replicative DNA helicase n=1 Tax=Escherichia coli TaxID=562 RepID=A0A376L3A2_ECOLX|nr:replicative DNA helicase [Escherichia coli]